MSSITKRQVLLVCGDKLIARVVGCAAAAAQLVVSEAIELVAVGVERGVVVDGLGGHFDEDARWDVLAVGEGDTFENSSSERCWLLLV